MATSFCLIEFEMARTSALDDCLLESVHFIGASRMLSSITSWLQKHDALLVSMRQAGLKSLNSDSNFSIMRWKAEEDRPDMTEGPQA